VRRDFIEIDARHVRPSLLAALRTAHPFRMMRPLWNAGVARFGVAKL
jgi:hypothetical protein